MRHLSDYPFNGDDMSKDRWAHEAGECVRELQRSLAALLVQLEARKLISVDGLGARPQSRCFTDPKAPEHGIY